MAIKKVNDNHDDYYDYDFDNHDGDDNDNRDSDDNDDDGDDSDHYYGDLLQLGASLTSLGVGILVRVHSND